jgi:UrcA family protein
MPAPWIYGIRSYSMKLVAATAATLITTAVFASVSAASLAADLETRTAVVHYDDLNLRSQVGAATLERRIAGAVETVCRRPNDRSLAELAREAACRQTAVAEAQPKLRSALASAGRTTRFADGEMLASLPST